MSDNKDICLNLIYSRTLSHLPHHEISPAIKYESEYSYSKGNINLKPSYSNSLDFSFVLKDEWNFYYYYTVTKNDIHFLTFLDEDKPFVKYSMPENAGRSYLRSGGLDKVFSITNWWTLSTDTRN